MCVCFYHGYHGIGDKRGQTSAMLRLIFLVTGPAPSILESVLDVFFLFGGACFPAQQYRTRLGRDVVKNDVLSGCVCSAGGEEKVAAVGGAGVGWFRSLEIYQLQDRRLDAVS